MKLFAKPRVGLDIGHRTVKAVKLTRKGGKVHLEKYIFYDLAEGNANFPTVKGLDETLKALIDVAGFKNHQAYACIDDSNVASFELTLPIMPKNELLEAVSNDIENKIGFPIEEASVDLVNLGETIVNDEKMLNVRAYCARISDVAALADILTNSKLNLTNVDVTMLTNIGMLHFNEYLENDSHSIIVDLGESKTSAALVNGQKLIATYDIPTSLGTINSRLKQLTGMSYIDAEKIKSKLAQKHAEEETKEQEVVDSVYLELFQNLQRSMDFFRASANGAPINKILAIGGGSQYASIVATIEATCGITTVAANPFRNIEIFSNKKINNEKVGQFAAHMCTAVGLALRGIDAA